MNPLEQESWLVQRLAQHGAAVICVGPFASAGDSVRLDSVRCAILDHGLTEVIVGRSDGKPQTYAQAFERVYGEPLIRPKKRTRRADVCNPPGDPTA